MIIAASPWSLHPRLEKDAMLVGDLPLSRILAVMDANFPWVLLVPRGPAHARSSTSPSRSSRN